MQIEMVSLAEIYVPVNWRSANIAEVGRIAASIEMSGLLQPIGATPARQVEGEPEPKRRLLWGRHRMLAFQQLGRTEIPAHVMDLDDVHAEMATLVENLRCAPLSKLEIGEQTARAVELYHALYPETKRGSAAGKASGGSRREQIPSTNVGRLAPTVQPEEPSQPDAGTAIGADSKASKRTVNERADIGSMPEDIRNEIRQTPMAERQRDLRELATLCRQDPDQARLIAQTVGAGLADTLKGARARLEAEHGLVKDQRGSTVRARIRPAVMILPDMLAEIVSLYGKAATTLKRARKRLEDDSQRFGMDRESLGQVVDVLAEREERRLRNNQKAAQRCIPHAQCDQCDGLGITSLPTNVRGTPATETCRQCNGQGWIDAGLFHMLKKQKLEAGSLESQSASGQREPGEEG